MDGAGGPALAVGQALQRGGGRAERGDGVAASRVAQRAIGQVTDQHAGRAGRRKHPGSVSHRR